MSGARGTRRRWRRAVLALVVALLLGEVALRLVGTTDPDGNFVLAGRRIRPFRVPLHHLEEMLAAYAAPQSYLRWDAELGWRPVPGAGSADGAYLYNEQAVRVGQPGRVYAEAPPEGARRVLLLGDSFVHGDEVPFAETLGAQLEELARERGLALEVVNLGVPGYGMGQALLRYRAEGRRLHADVVVMGFQAENVGRNVNLARTFFWWRSALPFTKPRFVLEPGGLSVVNRPSVPPSEIPAVLRDPERWPLIRYEHFFVPEDYRAAAWQRSRLLAVGAQALGKLRGRGTPQDTLYEPQGEPWRVTLALLETLAAEVAADGGRCLLVHLPIQPHLAELDERGALPYAALLERVRARHDLADPAPELLAAAREEGLASLFTRAGGGHYSGRGNRLVARTLVEALGR